MSLLERARMLEQEREDILNKFKVHSPNHRFLVGDIKPYWDCGLVFSPASLGPITLNTMKAIVKQMEDLEGEV